MIVENKTDFFGVFARFRFFSRSIILSPAKSISKYFKKLLYYNVANESSMIHERRKNKTFNPMPHDLTRGKDTC